jgi:hypothetical protein
MKTLKNILLMSFIMLIFPIAETFAQGPPPWAPAHGYRAKTRYVYFPDHNFYFDLRNNMYIYMSGSNWIVNTSIPFGFTTTRLRSAAAVELDFYSDRPYRYNADHKIKYKSKGGPPPGHQKGHPGNGNGKGKGKG